jgi:hypothetical protein
MTEESLRRLLGRYFVEFRQHDSGNAGKVKAGLKKCPKELDNDDLILWWKQQDTTWITSLQSYMFWMWTSKKVEYQVFENIYENLTPVISQSWNMPIEITTGLDSPLLEGGFLSKEFSIFQFKFSPSNHELVVTSQEIPPPKNRGSLDLVLDFLSFMLDHYEYGYLGFRQKPTRKWSFSQRTTLEGGLGPEIRQDMLNFDFQQFEKVLTRIASDENQADGELSLVELLRIRHRAILDSSLESKLITLWSSVEAMWGEEEKEDILLTKEEKEKVADSIEFLPETKFRKVVERVSTLKNKTKNDKIVEEIGKLDCGKSIEGLSKKVRDIFSMRSRFAHGKFLSEQDVDVVSHYVTFLMQIFDELIAKQLLANNIILKRPS